MIEEDRRQRLRAFVENFEWRLWKRVFLLFFLLTVATIAIGSLTPLNEEDVTQIQEALEQFLPHDPNVLLIFANNFAIASLMFIPLLGPVAGVIILHNTGLAIAATAMSVNLPGVLILLGLLLFPFAWLEFISYSVAMTQSLFLVLSLLRRRSVRKELMRTSLLWAAISVTLLVAAFIEMLFV